MKSLKSSYETSTVVVDRAYFEANHGRASLALDRLQELADESTEDAHSLYAQGSIRRDYLGQGIAARTFFEKAYKLSLHRKSGGETGWFALCNLAGLAGNKDELGRWVEKALQERRDDKKDFKHFIDMLRLLDKGASYTAILLDESQVHIKAHDYGLGAAVLEVALSEGGMPLTTELSARLQRALSLRALDSKAERIRTASAEAFPPDERLTLQEAVSEVTKCIALDEYDATLWNYKSAWCALLTRFEEAIRCADRAIELRPSNYPRPYVNKTQALWALGRDTEALMCAKEAVRQAEVAGESPADVEQGKSLLNACSQPRVVPALDDMIAIIQHIIRTAETISEQEFAQTRAVATKTTLDKVSQRLTGQIWSLQRAPFIKYVPVMIELLSDFTPETAFCASLKVAQYNKSLVEYLITSALYIAAISQGVLRRDAARYFCLMLLVFVNGAAIRAYYRQAILETSAAALDEMANLDNIMRKELGSINPFLPQLIADQEPVNEEESERAIRNVLSHFFEQ